MVAVPSWHPGPQTIWSVLFHKEGGSLPLHNILPLAPTTHHPTASPCFVDPLGHTRRSLTRVLGTADPPPQSRSQTRILGIEQPWRALVSPWRSQERRVGKEGRSRWAP